MNIEDIKTQKEDIRSKFLATRKVMSDQEVEDKSAAIISRLGESIKSDKAKLVHCYISITRRREVNTKDMIRGLLKKGVRVAVPVTDLKDKKLIHSEIKSLDDLEVGTFGIIEPKKEDLRPLALGQIELALVPGLAFDPRGNRIGYGAGFYDTFLKDLQAPKIALAYGWQVIPRITPTPYDVPVDGIVTEERYYECASQK